MINCLPRPIATRRGQGVERRTGRSSVNPWNQQDPTKKPLSARDAAVWQLVQDANGLLSEREIMQIWALPSNPVDERKASPLHEVVEANSLYVTKKEQNNRL